MTEELRMSAENIVSPTPPKLVIDELSIFPPIAGFWRRLISFLIDFFLVAIVGLLLGGLFSKYLYNIGPYGQPLGLILIIPYFGILNSKIGNGQTLGKKIFHIAVRNKDNDSIGLVRSLIRISILSIPPLLNGLSIPFLKSPIISWLFSVIIFGFGGALFYTMVFNRKARQGLHDLLLGTFVVNLKGKKAIAFPITPGIHLIISALIIGLVAIGTVAIPKIFSATNSNNSLENVENLYQTLQGDSRFFTANINSRTTFRTNLPPTKSLIINVWVKGKLSQEEKQDLLISVYHITMVEINNLGEYDVLQIVVTSGYEIGIARYSTNIYYLGSLADWEKFISQFEKVN
jgi:uncharacterized RDD family membrane protein YckC